MIAGELKNWRNHPGLAEHPVWAEAFAWIEKNAATSEEGIFPLVSEGCKVRVMSYPLRERKDANFENHSETVDLQYTIKGAEGIEVTSADKMIAKGEYLPEKDFQFYETPAEISSLVHNLQGRFCILFPEDIHQPQRILPGYDHVTKLVVKIPLSSVR